MQGIYKREYNDAGESFDSYARRGGKGGRTKVGACLRLGICGRGNPVLAVMAGSAGDSGGGGAVLASVCLRAGPLGRRGGGLRNWRCWTSIWPGMPVHPTPRRPRLGQKVCGRGRALNRPRTRTRLEYWQRRWCPLWRRRSQSAIIAPDLDNVRGCCPFASRADRAWSIGQTEPGRCVRRLRLRVALYP